MSDKYNMIAYDLILDIYKNLNTDNFPKSYFDLDGYEVKLSENKTVTSRYVHKTKQVLDKILNELTGEIS